MAENALLNEKALNKAYKEFIKLSTDDIGRSIEKTGFRFFQLLQVFTPRDTGRAENGWIPVVNQPASEWKPQKGLSTYSAKKFPLGQIKFNSVVWISNNVEYIIPLDEGHSLQAPYGFTNNALQKTTFYIQREIDKLNRKKYNV